MIIFSDVEIKEKITHSTALAIKPHVRTHCAPKRKKWAVGGPYNMLVINQVTRLHYDRLRFDMIKGNWFCKTHTLFYDKLPFSTFFFNRTATFHNS